MGLPCIFWATYYKVVKADYLAHAKMIIAMAFKIYSTSSFDE
jgi:hypothetical protein